MRRRLGMRPRRVFWDYSELYSVTLLLIWWSAMFRAIWVHCVIFQIGALDIGWLSPTPGAPPILKSLAWIATGLLVMTCGCFLEPRNRTRVGFAIGGFNLAFVVVLGCAVFLHTVFAAEYATHRASGARSEWNLAAELAGDWEVSRRAEPAGAPHFPARGLSFDYFGLEPVLRLHFPGPEVRAMWATLEPTAEFNPTTRLFERWPLIGGRGRPPRLEQWGSPTRTAGVHYEPPAVLVEELVAPEIRAMPSEGYCIWVAEMHQPNLDQLEFRLVHVDGSASPPDARFWLRRADASPGGRDLGAELAFLRGKKWE